MTQEQFKMLAKQNPNFEFKQNGETVILTKYKGTAENGTLQSVVIPNGVTEIGKCAFDEGAFNHHPILRSVVIPDSVTIIGQGAFNWCTALQSVVIPKNVTLIKEAAFRFCESLQSVIIPASVKKIEDLAFYRCSSLQSVTILNLETRIGLQAFPKQAKIVWARTMSDANRNAGQPVSDLYARQIALIIRDGNRNAGQSASDQTARQTAAQLPTDQTAQTAPKHHARHL